MNTLPEDPAILLSYINMKLRDYYTSLDDLCQDLAVDRSEIETKLKQSGFAYDPTNNRFW